MELLEAVPVCHRGYYRFFYSPAGYFFRVWTDLLYSGVHYDPCDHCQDSGVW